MTEEEIAQEAKEIKAQIVAINERIESFRKKGVRVELKTYVPYVWDCNRPDLAVIQIKTVREI